jgi:hypothetical protein
MSGEAGPGPKPHGKGCHAWISREAWHFGPAAGRSEQALECLHARDHGVGVIGFWEVGEIAGVHLGREGGLALYAGRLAGAAVEGEPPP